MRRLAAFLILAVTAAPALVAQTRPTPSSDGILAGKYDLEVTFGGGVVEGTLTIAIAGDSLTATLLVGGHQSPIRAGARRGSHLVLEPSGSVAIRYELDFKGEEVTGSFSYEGQPGSVKGRRQAAAR